MKIIVILAIMFFLVGCSKTPTEDLQNVIKEWSIAEGGNEGDMKANFASRATKAIEAGADSAADYEGYMISDLLYYADEYDQDEVKLFYALIHSKFHEKVDDGAFVLEQLASKSRNVDVVNIFLNSGIVIDNMHSFILNVVAAGLPATSRLVLDRYSQQTENDWGEGFADRALDAVVESTADYRASAIENLNIFLDKGSKPSQTNTDYMLFEAVTRLDMESIHLLKKLGGNFSKRDDDGNTLLIDAAKNYTDLISDGDAFSQDVADVDAKSTFVYEYLINESVDINGVNKNGKTALIVAADSFNVPLVKLLLSNDADTTVRDKSSKQAIDYVTETPKTANAKKDIAASFLFAALLLESGLTKADIRLIKGRNIEIRQLLKSHRHLSN